MSDRPRYSLTPPQPIADRLAALRNLIPEAIRDGAIDAEALAAAVGLPVVGERAERFGFGWTGKTDSIRLLSTPSHATLLPMPDDSIAWATTDHAIIEGDNLAALRVILKGYFGRVKMIYIDPPYNTGGDFIYPDNYAVPLDPYLRLTGQADDEGNRLTSRADTSGRRHSTWLSMLYPRLMLARNLLREDGVIFISIDDHEVHHLRVILDELFGEENFVGMFVWKRRTGSNDPGVTVSTDQEYIVVYRRTDKGGLNGLLKDFANYTNPDRDPRGPWARDNLTSNKTADERPNLFYPITDPKTGIVYQPNPARVWAYERKRMEQLIKEGKVLFPADGKGTPGYKRHQSEVRSDRKPVSTWIETSRRNGHDVAEEQFEDEVSILQVPLNSKATRELRDLMGDQVFSFPKSVQLLKEIIRQATTPDAGDIVLDFFAGSGTTAQAVLELNQEDGGDRRFILIQLPEPIASAHYPTIAHITRERVRRVIARITGGQDGALFPTAADLGFRAYRLTPSHFRPWDSTPPDHPDQVFEQMRQWVDDPFMPGWTADGMIAEVALDLGYGLNMRVETVDRVPGTTVWRVTDPDKGQHFYICLDETVPDNLPLLLGLTMEDLLVCRDNALNDSQINNFIVQARLRTL